MSARDLSTVAPATVPERVTITMSREAVEALLDLLTKNPELLPPEHRVSARAALLGAVLLGEKE